MYSIRVHTAARFVLMMFVLLITFAVMFPIIVCIVLTKALQLEHARGLERLPGNKPTVFGSPKHAFCISLRTRLVMVSRKDCKYAYYSWQALIVSSKTMRSIEQALEDGADDCRSKTEAGRP